jgi:hypothetical protein
MSRDPFTDFVRDALTALPEHLKETLRLVDDPDIPDEGRALAAGVLLHWLSGQNTIPGIPGGVLSLVDDTLMLRLTYERLQELAPEAMSRHMEASPELFGELKTELAVMREELGDGMKVLNKALDKLPSMKHHGLVAKQCVNNEEDGTVLYEEVQSALVDLEPEEDEIARALKDLGPALEGLRRRAG